jgi:ketosteroid isomerase-like protein
VPGRVVQTATGLARLNGSEGGNVFMKSIDRRGLSGLTSVAVMLEAKIILSRLLRRWITCALVLAVGFCLPTPALSAAPPHSGMPRAQKHESRHEIDQLEEAWRNAVLTSNTAIMESLLADDYMAITPNGTLQSKEQALTNLRSGATRISALEISDRKVRFYRATALVTSRADVTGTNAAGNFSGSFRYTRVYVRNAQGKWKIVSFEASRIRGPGEPR